MTKAEILSVLNQYLKAKRRYITTSRNLEECETMITRLSIDYSKEKVKSTPNPDKMTELIDRLIYLKGVFLETAEESTAKMEETLRFIETIDNSVHHEIISRHYIHDETWEEIAEEMNYTYRYILKLHDEALKGIGDKHGEKI